MSTAATGATGLDTDVPLASNATARLSKSISPTFADSDLAWWMDLGPQNSVTQPIAIDGVLYFATGYSIVHAVVASASELVGGASYWNSRFLARALRDIHAFPIHAPNRIISLQMIARAMFDRKLEVSGFDYNELPVTATRMAKI
jgi:alkylation response protein AidB-like acyl-CoA dehydrogenase